MAKNQAVDRLAAAIGQAKKTARFCVAGSLPNSEPGIEVNDLGAINFPLAPKTVKKLIGRAHVAPYGKGTKTLVDKSVRNTYQLDPEDFCLSEKWNAAIEGVTRAAAEKLGLPADQVVAKLYKMLVYERGGFFLPHRDSEKEDRMVASMIVVLPNPYQGGSLLVRHGGVEQRVDFKDAAAGTSPCYAAFYADCEHEVERVTGGIRICLAYNLTLKLTKWTKAKPSASTDRIAESIASWMAAQPAKPLVFAMEHHYTERGLSLDLLKGADRELAESVVPAAEKAGALAHFAQVERHLLQFADDGSYGRGHSRYYATVPGNLEIGETYEDDLNGTQWTDMSGKKQPWGAIAFDLPAIVASTPIDQWKPTKEEYEGYNGNAGNELDRWYHRSAIVVWHRDKHFDVVASSGAEASMPLFVSMMTKLAKTPEKRLEAARNDCIRFARAIIAKWPERWAHSTYYGYRDVREKSPCDGFPAQLLALHDRESIASFLSIAAPRDQTLQLRSFILAACREFGWRAFETELKHLISVKPEDRRETEIPLRDMQWLAGICCDKAADPEKAAMVAKLCAIAVQQFCKPRPSQTADYGERYRRPSSESERALCDLLKALIAGERSDDLARVVSFVEKSPRDFDMDLCQVPCLVDIIPWSQKRIGKVLAPLASWLAAVRQQLESATAEPPSVPGDWTRPANAKCNCKLCGQLNAFLADPANEKGRIAAKESDRSHLIGMIDRHQCDVEHKLERKGSPFALVLTKTTGSFNRSVKRFEANLQLLDSLPNL